MNPNQNQNQYNNVPSIKQPGDWSPLSNYSNDVPPPQKKSFFSKYKKLIIVSVIAILLLIGMAVVASLSKSKTAKVANKVNVHATTNVPLTFVSNDKFSLDYPKSMNIISDLSTPDDGWLVVLGQNVARIEIALTKNAPYYADSEEGLAEQQALGVEPINVTTTDVVIAGIQTKKSVGEVTGDDGKQLNTVFTSAKVGDKYIVVSGYYPKDNQDINDSFDAMLGSISLK